MCLLGFVCLGGVLLGALIGFLVWHHGHAWHAWWIEGGEHIKRRKGAK